jgi:CubicO group peptidase (beta-lactamase class C family)
MFLFCPQNYDAIVKKYDTFNGIVLVASQGKIEFLKGFGLANRQDNILINPQSKFRICSITKTFTAVMILQLMEAGKLKLSDKISQHLPNVSGIMSIRKLPELANLSTN